MGCVEVLDRLQTDYVQRPLRPSFRDFFCLVFSIVFHLIDLGTDIYAAISYYSEDKLCYCVATLLVVLIPSFVTSCVSYRMYIHNKDEGKIPYVWNRKMSYRTIMLFLPFAPLFRGIDSLTYACKSRMAERRKNTKEQETYYLLMQEEDSDLALLRILESFLESAPQQILQISNLLKYGFTIPPTLAVASSFLGMAACIMSYQGNIRKVQETKNNIGFVGSGFIFMSQMFLIISRILMLTLVFITSVWALLTIVLVHWIVMTGCIAKFESHKFCSRRSSTDSQQPHVLESICNFLFSAIFGLVYIFVFIFLGEGRTFYRHLGFYSICLLENILGAIVVFLLGGEVWFSDIWTALCVCVAPHVIGCVLLIVYYIWFHPNHPISLSGLLCWSKKKASKLPESSNKKNDFALCEVGQGDIKKPSEESYNYEKL